MDENISRAAGAAHGQLMEEAEFRAIVEPLGRRLEQRTTLYGRTRTDPAPVPQAMPPSRAPTPSTIR
jgi:FO synthase